MSTPPPNTTLLQAKDQFPSNKTPAPITGPSEQATFGYQKLSPPSNLYVQRDDRLLIVASSSNGAAESITIEARVLLVPLAPGEQPRIAITRQTFACGSVALNSINVLDLSEGFLLSVAAFGANTTVRGFTFIRALIVRGAPIIGNTVFVLFADYVTSNSPAGWPYGRAIYPTEGPGGRNLIVLGNPAGGADWSTSLPLAQRWRLMCASALLTTAVAVANRTVQLQFASGASIFFRGAASQVIPASTAAQVSFGPDLLTSTVLATDVLVGFPLNVWLDNGDTISVVTSNLQAADQWSNIVLAIEQWQDQI